MSLGVSSWSFHKDLGAGRLTLLDFPYKAKAMGFEAIEVLVSHLNGNAHVLQERCEDAGLIWSCVSAENNFAIIDEAIRREQVEDVKRAIDSASQVDVGVVRAFFGNFPGEPPVGLKYLTMEALKETAAYAEQKGVVVGMENHGNYINTADEIIEMLETIDSEYLRACPDTGNFRGEIYSEIEKVAPYAAHVHTKTFAFDEDGNETSLNYQKIFRIFKNCGFDGTYSLEFEGEGDETENVEKSISLFRRYIGQG
jgi:sugar phosphate isomerase/epimerase